MTGSRSDSHLEAVQGSGLRPALFAGYRELAELRHDFPVVLVENPNEGLSVQSLTSLMDAVLTSAATGGDGERIRKHVLRLEREIRTLVSTGSVGTLAALWERAAQRLMRGSDTLLEDSLRRARAGLQAEGQVIDCNAALPRQLIEHVWSAGQKQQASRFRTTLERLALKLSDILRADFERSAAGRSAKSLQSAVGTGFGEAFDFGSMSKLLAKALPREEFPEARRQRINGLLEALNHQQFVPLAGQLGSRRGRAKPYSFVFNSCSEALKAYRERMPKLIALAKAIAIAKLEIDGLYSESKHNILFEQFGLNGLDRQEQALFPDYLVCVDGQNMPVAEQAHLMDILSSGLPIKVLLQIDDILDGASKSHDKITSGTRSRQLAKMAIGLGEAYVLQSSSSNLVNFRERVIAGLNFHGPALFSVYSGVCATAGGLAPYLAAAAAMESRAFPAFTYDPSAGLNWASRFHLEANPQLELDWPVQTFAYEDQQHQRVSEELAFTLVDFLACDSRYAKHLARVPREKWTGNMVAVDAFLRRDRRGLPDELPCLWMVGEANTLHKVIVDERLIREALRCRDMWHNLQELAGIHNSHAEILLAREKKAWEERMQQEAQTLAPQVPAANAMAGPTVAAEAQADSQAVEQEPERSPDEAYIETARCSTCNECTLLNNKMFAYDGNQQAYIVDCNAGTYAQLVEAAENCQVSVIHPGKPRNPAEPGLAELLKRAEAFL